MHNQVSKPRVLFVDDYADFVNMLPLVFANEPFEVVVADGGEKALSLFDAADLARTNPDGSTRCPFDLVVLDVAMPELNGPTCALRMARLHPTCPFVFLTGQPESLWREPGAEEVAPMNIPIWNKPMEVAELRANILARLQETTI